MTRDFRTRLQTGRAVLLDGAMGTELAARGVEITGPEWSARALLSAPAVVTAVHADSVAAGAEIITANTFRTHARNLAHAGLADRAGELTARAVQLAREAAGDFAWVAGSQGPLEDCYLPQRVPDDAALAREHRRHARFLAAAGVDLILVETQNTIREALAAVAAARETGLPVLVSFVCGSGGGGGGGADVRLLSGESLQQGANAVSRLEVEAVLVNCLPASAVVSALESIAAGSPDGRWGAYANTGIRDAGDGWRPTASTDAAYYAGQVREWIGRGAAIVGGCCGTTPAHIAAVRREMNSAE